MELSPWFVAVVLLGLVVFGIVLCTRMDRKQGYDERQLQIRANAYRIGFVSLMVAVLALMFLQTWSRWTEVVDNSFALLAALMFSLTVFGVYCILHDAFFKRTESPKAYFILCIVVLAGNALPVIGNLTKNKSLLVNGKLTFSSGGNAVCVVTFFAFLIALVIKALKKPEEDDE